jgi:hypothetical protein
VISPLRRVSPLHRDQLVRRLFEFLGRYLDGLAFVDRLDFAQPIHVSRRERVGIRATLFAVVIVAACGTCPAVLAAR